MHFSAGLENMLIELDPKIVLVYGSMPEKVVAPFAGRTKFVFFPDWISLVHGGKH